MAYSIIGHTSAGSADGNSATTAGLNTTGADLLIAVAGYYTGGTAPSLTDSNSNTWTGQTIYPASGSGGRVRIYRCSSPIVGAGHTVTLSGTGSLPSVALIACSGSAASPLDAEASAAGLDGSPAQPGSITPAGNNELFVTAMASSSGDSQTFSVDSSFTIIETVQPSFLVRVALVIATLIETTATAKNPTWSWTITADLYAVGQAAFKAAVAGGSLAPRPLLVGQGINRASTF